jgi:hypothetical protein
MARASRIEGIAGRAGGVGGKTKGLSRAQIKKIQKAKPLAEPKSAVKVIKSNPIIVQRVGTTPQLRAATNKALANSAKGKTQTPTAEAARRKALKEKEAIAKKSAQQARIMLQKRAF